MDNNAAAARYTFIPWLRQDLATFIPNQETLAGGVESSISLPVQFQVNETQPVALTARLYGPGDITGLDPRQVIRTEPANLTTDFEYNYFPAIEFDRPDFPWLFTPARANVQQRLRPWLCLVVVRRQNGVSLKAANERSLPVLEIQSPAQPAAELPDLGESWAWAHTQLYGSLAAGPLLQEIMAANPERVISRLLCPRKLEPATQYYACVVPAFEIGCKAGLGEPIETTDEAELHPSWPNPVPARVRLPVYYHWEFATADAGDFEQLVRRLITRPLPPQLGIRPLDISAAGAGLPVLPGSILPLEGALRVPQSTPTPWPDSTRLPFQAALQKLLNISTVQNNSSPVGAPPVYGCWPAARLSVPGEGETPHWLRELNLDPRFRAIAGLGAQVVQAQQEQLMASAWEQAGQLKEANRALGLAQLARSIGQVLHRKRFTRMPESTLFQLTGPVHSRLRSGNVTLRQQIASSAAPLATAQAAFRRITRPQGPVRRKIPVPSTLTSLAQRLYTLNLAASPDVKAPAGIVTFEGLSVATNKPLANRRLNGLTPERLKSVAGKSNFKFLAERVVPDLTTITPGQGDSPEATRFRAVAIAHQRQMLKVSRARPTVPRPVLALTETRNMLLNRLDPKSTLLNRLKERLQLPQAAWQRPDPLDPLIVEPAFPQPMYEVLRELSQDFIIPGLQYIPPNTVSLLETNTRFVEAYMVGLNHEMSRELLWREFPTDQHGTYFRQFWDVRGQVPAPATEAECQQLEDIGPVKAWPPGNHLGQNTRGTGQGRLVLLIRGDLIRRYSTATVYLVKADWAVAQERRVIGNLARYPLFRGSLGSDILFVGFDLTVAQARGSSKPNADQGWFFVIQQHPTEPRFGLDVATGFGPQLPRPAGWNDLTWGHLAENEAAFQAITHASPTGRIAGLTIGGVNWGANSAHMAYATLQKPVRIIFHADQILPS